MYNSDESFLSRVADFILDHYKDQTHELTVVFPNKRAGLYLKKTLSKKINRTIWLPQITTIEKFISSWTGIHIADPLKLQFDLIEIHLGSGLNNELDAIEFSNRTEQLLRDFDEIDHYLVDADKLFKYLTDAKAIELWHADGSLLTDYEKKYLAFYKSVIHYYRSLRNKLTESNSAYPGMLFRKLAEAEPEELIKAIPGRYILFAGFNALSPAEEKMISSLIKYGRAKILWDLDEYYYAKNRFGEHEAGLFARRFNRRFADHQPSWVTNKLLTSSKKINIIAVPGHISQAKAFANDFSKKLNGTPQDVDDTALILADESLITPVINSVPREAGRFNVTMGLPFHFSPVYQIIQTLFNLHGSIQSSSITNKLQAKKALMILSHNVWSAVFNEEEQIQLKNTINWIVDSGRLFLEIDDLISSQKYSEPVKDLILILLKSWNNEITTCFSCLNKLIRFMAGRLVQKQESQSGFLLLNHLSAAGRIINKLENLLKDKSHLIDLKGLRKLFTQIAPQTNVSLYGEPLEGLQIMGLLESRNLSFDTIYLLSANEGILPGEKNLQSIIPYDIKRHYNMPTHREKQAVFAYNFFRLMQSASEINIYYNSEPDSLGGGEKSRYILQLMHELSKLNPNIQITERVFTFPLVKSKVADRISIIKDKNLMKLNQNKAKSGFSPTSLATFINCPLQFYLKELLEIQKTDELEENIGMDVLGTIVHQALQTLYTPFVNAQLNKTIIKHMQSKAPLLLKQAFIELYSDEEVAYGKNRLVTEVAETFVKRFLEFESTLIENEPIKILELESRMEYQFNLNGQNIKLKGTADRIDLRKDGIHIIDYKTGKVDKNELELKDWEDLVDGSKKSKALQLVIYSFLYFKSNPQIEENNLTANIISLRKLSDGLLQAKFPGEGFSMEEAEKTITQILQQIFDMEQPFEQTSDETKCKYCDFKDLCNRHDTSYGY